MWCQSTLTEPCRWPSFGRTYFTRVDNTDGILGTQEKLDHAVFQFVYWHAVQLDIPQKQVTAFYRGRTQQVGSPILQQARARAWACDLSTLLSVQIEVPCCCLLTVSRYVKSSFSELATESDMEWLSASSVFYVVVVFPCATKFSLSWVDGSVRQWPCQRPPVFWTHQLVLEIQYMWPIRWNQ